MKIVHLLGYFQPELGYKEYYIARNQVKKGHEVHIVASNKVVPLHDSKALAEKLNLPVSRDRGSKSLGTSNLEGISVHRLPEVLEIKDFILTRGIWDNLKKIQPDIVHAYAPGQGTTVFGAIYKKRLNYFLIADDQILPETNKPYKSFQGALRYNIFQRWVNYLYFGSADAVFLPNNGSKEYFEKHYNIKNKSKLVSVGFDQEVFYFDERARFEVRSKFGIEKDDFLIVAIARLTQDKGFEQIFQAAKSLFLTGKLKMLLVGDGDYKEKLKQKVLNLGLENKICFEDFMPEKVLYRYFSAGDLAIWTKRPSVGISNAIGCSLPVLVPESNFFDHLVEVGNGVTFEKDNLDDLTKKLEEIIKDKGKYQVLKENTLKAQKNFSYETLAGEDIRAYLEKNNVE